jgi:hypothetical protein
MCGLRRIPTGRKLMHIRGMKILYSPLFFDHSKHITPLTAHPTSVNYKTMSEYGNKVDGYLQDAMHLVSPTFLWFRALPADSVQNQTLFIDPAKAKQSAQKVYMVSVDV